MSQVSTFTIKRENVVSNGQILNGAVVTGLPGRQSGTQRLLQWLRGRNQTACGCLRVSGNSLLTVSVCGVCFPSHISPGNRKETFVIRQLHALC